MDDFYIPDYPVVADMQREPSQYVIWIGNITGSTTSDTGTPLPITSHPHDHHAVLMDAMAELAMLPDVLPFLAGAQCTLHYMNDLAVWIDVSIPAEHPMAFSYECWIGGQWQQVSVETPRQFRLAAWITPETPQRIYEELFPDAQFDPGDFIRVERDPSNPRDPRAFFDGIPGITFIDVIVANDAPEDSASEDSASEDGNQPDEA